MTDAWRIDYSMADMAYQVWIHGKPVMDAETGKQALFFPEGSSKEELEAWVDQFKKSITNMSGVECNAE